MIDRFERFSFAISEIYRYWHKIAADVMEQYGMKGPHAVYFTTLYQYPQGVTAARLAELCGKDKADVSRMISILIEKGFVYRAELEDQQYRRPLLLTDKGKAAACQVLERIQMAVEKAGSGLDETHRKVFYESLEQISENLRRLSLQ